MFLAGTTNEFYKNKNAHNQTFNIFPSKKNLKLT